MRTEQYILDALDALSNSQIADDPDQPRIFAGVGRKELARVRKVVELARESNARAQNLERLAADAVECQSAVNPRPISERLWHASLVVMEKGGNPAYQNSPITRLYLNALLGMLDHSSLPAYERNTRLFSEDVDFCVSLTNQPAS
jgi:hypothetical protein